MVLSEAMANQEVERYTFWAPGQANAYFYGYMRLRELRGQVEKAMGSRFNPRAFHDFVLAQGSVAATPAQESRLRGVRRPAVSAVAGRHDCPLKVQTRERVFVGRIGTGSLMSRRHAAQKRGRDSRLAVDRKAGAETDPRPRAPSPPWALSRGPARFRPAPRWC